ncbi:MAG: DUF1289 domain-containing protein [Pseudomonadales bacterium]
MKLFQKIGTPCIGVCSTGIGDSVCRGCKRFDYEVIQWNGFDESQKQAIDQRLETILSSVVERYLHIFDSQRLASQLQLQQLRYASHRDPYCWLFELLRAGASQIDNPAQYGFLVRESGERSKSDASGINDANDNAATQLQRLREQIDKEFYLLSVAHFERYIVANRSRARYASSATSYR